MNIFVIRVSVWKGSPPVLNATNEEGLSAEWLTHWGRVTHICVSKLTIIGSDNGLSPGRRQAIIWTNAGILLIRTLGTNSSEIVIEILSFSFKKMRLKLSSAKWRLFGLGLNELTHRRNFQQTTVLFLIIEKSISFAYKVSISVI